MLRFNLSIFVLVGLQLILTQQLLAQSASHDAIIWQGFEFRWLHTNHRLNCFGSRVQMTDRDSIKVSNSAKSGSNPDAWRFWNHLSYVHSNSLKFVLVSDTIYIMGSTKDTEPIKIYDHSIPIPYQVGQESVEAFINGFELNTDMDAKKLISYHITVDSVYSANKQIDLVASYSFSFKCTPLAKIVKGYECISDTIHYRMICDYLIVIGTYGPPRIDNFSNNTSWTSTGGLFYHRPRRSGLGAGRFNGVGTNYDTRKQPLKPNSLYYNSDLIHTMDMAAENQYLTGIKEISAEIEPENHLAYWSQFISTVNNFGYALAAPPICPECKNHNINAGLYYSPWQYNIQFWFKFVSQAKKGGATLKIRTSTINIPEKEASVISFSTFRFAKYFKRFPSSGSVYNTYTLQNIKKSLLTYGAVKATYIEPQ